ncbi:RNA polymerase sigma-70 factor (ECF subfamily) [Breznakia sp. PF5-3]|uniref:RNA polymerase sigma factor n=1 Tax=unclassified Breznakia TaxID=2623764 RepID=UPI0024057379|nr:MULTISPECIES: RNA polymerase sigma factor [unclassified Breznakia]MDF9824017.1 RNA polymerase sigma-70 factor (ECF subfamily) [Breznakia sp. PM6-1]MDF9834816.1 RNA polymerase sigma-70 factor (ECF subfamily) [Breznakia sp. PF5-3]MDF9838135.1 RNA polymerase sigma-70 factor (ECF subfamily) [Breznakia sp. PFB2-8]MDF9860121.1 RNA polymerase sigma-70 factor (ECF subfamily) [Breznakia sp. PH5-24]
MDHSQFEEYIDKYSNLVFHVALANTSSFHDAQDIAQEVYIKLYKSKPFESEEHLKNWLVRVTINQCNSLHRRFFKKKHVDVDINEFIISKESIQVHDELMALSKEERTIVYLYYIEGYTYKEISDMTGRSISSVSRDIKNSLKYLKSQMEESS